MERAKKGEFLLSNDIGLEVEDKEVGALLHRELREESEFVKGS